MWPALVVTAGAVGTMSYVLRRWPRLVHAKKAPHPYWSEVFNIAHRGGRELTPENTLASFTASSALCDAVELDVWVTADGEVAVLHDGDLRRVTGVEGHVRELKAADLPVVLARPSDGHRQGEGEGLQPQQLPLLKQVLPIVRRTENLAVMVEFKENSAALRQKVHALLRDEGLLERASCFSLDGEINAELRAHENGAFFICSDVGRIALIYCCYYIGLIGFIPTSWFDPLWGFTILQLKNLGFFSRIPVVRSLPESVQWAIADKLPALTMRPKLFRHLQERGIRVWCLGVNDEEKYETALALGVESVLTDRPAWLAALRKNDERAAPSGDRGHAGLRMRQSSAPVVD